MERGLTKASLITTRELIEVKSTSNHLTVVTLINRPKKKYMAGFLHEVRFFINNTVKGNVR